MNAILPKMLRRSLVFNVLIPLLFFSLALCLMPVHQAFQFDTDEGLELVKAALVSKGFSLYTEIWNDQPPFLTVLFAYGFKIFGQSIVVARLIVLSFATLLVWCFSQILRICLGDLAAIIGTIFLVISCNFLRLSVSAMAGLPSLALAMLSIYTLILYQQKPRLYLIILAGSSLAISLQIKMFTVFLIPILLFQLIRFRIRENSEEQSVLRLIFPAFWLLISLLFTFAFTGISLNS